MYEKCFLGADDIFIALCEPLCGTDLLKNKRRISDPHCIFVEFIFSVAPTDCLTMSCLRTPQREAGPGNLLHNAFNSVFLCVVGHHCIH